MKYAANLNFFIFLCSLVCSIPSYSQNKIFIDVGDAHVRKSKLAMPAFLALGTKTSEASEAGDELFSVISNDLAATGLFVNIEPKAFLEDTSATGLRPVGVTPNGFDFNKWKTLETEFLIRGGYQIAAGQITLEIYAYYVENGSLIVGKKYEGPLSTTRKIAHSFSNDLVKSITGKPSFFKSQIVVGIDSGPKSNREIYLGDWDGFNTSPITSHKTVTVSPAWSKNGEMVAYTAFVKRRSGGFLKRNPDLFIYELKTKRRWLVSYRDGLNSGAEFLPDNKNILLTLSNNKRADIYKMTVDGKSIEPITNGPGQAMNVEPAISPDGHTIAFSSDRSGKPMVYSMDITGANVKRRTFAGHYNSTPTWSPDGKKIAFAGFDNDKGNFDIFIMSLDGSELLRLSSARKANGKWSNNEDPAFAPDNRHILFISDRSGNKQLYMVNTDGTNERRITFDNKQYSKPKWGPLVE
jgi:TolB protein